MYIPIQSMIFFGGIFFFGQAYLKQINDRIDNRLAGFFSKVCPKVES